MKREIALHFRDELRDARAIALKDAEAFQHFVFVLERMGAYLTGRIEDLKRYTDSIAKQARRSPLAEDIPNELPAWHAPFRTLYELVRHARNDALHQGAFARHLTSHAVELTIVLEDALMEEAFGARDFMVRDPVCALLWQPISSVRRNMLANSFSFLPLAVDQSPAPIWKLVSDFSIASYLRAASSRSERTRRLARQLGDVVGTNEIALLDAPLCGPEDSVATILERSKGLPVLVIGLDGNVRGIITPFDVL